MMPRTWWVALGCALLFSACASQPPPGAATIPNPSGTTPANQPATVLPSPTSQAQPFSAAALQLASQSATLYAQDFESSALPGINDVNGAWSVVAENDGNHIYCNAASTNWQSFHFGTASWKDYLIQMWVKLMQLDPNGGVETYIRNDKSNQGYRATVSAGSADLVDSPPRSNSGLPRVLDPAERLVRLSGGSIRQPSSVLHQ